MSIKFEDFVKIHILDLINLENKFRNYNDSNKHISEKTYIIKFLNTNNSFLIFDKKYPRNSILTKDGIEKNQLQIFYNSLNIIKNAIISYRNNKGNFEKSYDLIEKQLVILIKLIKIKNLYYNDKKSFFSNENKDEIFKLVEFLGTNILKWKNKNEAIVAEQLTMDSNYLKFIKIIIDSYEHSYQNISKSKTIEGNDLFFKFKKSIEILKNQYSNFENNSVDKFIFVKKTLNEIENIFYLSSNLKKKSSFSFFSKQKKVLNTSQNTVNIWSYQKLINQLIVDFSGINANNFLEKIPEILNFYKSNSGIFLDSNIFKLGGLNNYEENIWKKNIINSLEGFEKDFKLFSKNNSNFNLFFNNINSINRVFFNLRSKINSEIPLNSKELEKTIDLKKSNSYSQIINSIQNYSQLIVYLQKYLKEISNVTIDAYKLKYVLKSKFEKINFLNQNKTSILTYLFKLKSDEERFNYYIKNINPNISMLRLAYEKELINRLQFKNETEKVLFESIKKQIDFISSNLSLVKSKKRSIPNFLADVEIARIKISKLVLDKTSQVETIRKEIVSEPEKEIIDKSQKKLNLFERILSYKLKKPKQQKTQTPPITKPKKSGFFSNLKNSLFGSVQFQMYVSLNLKNKFQRLEKGDIILNVRELLKLKNEYNNKKFRFNNDYEKEAYKRIKHIFDSLEKNLSLYDQNKININNFSIFIRNVVNLYNRIDSGGVNPNMDFNPEYNPI